MKKYTALYFDIDNTLLDFYAAEAHAIRALFEKFGLDNGESTISLYSNINKKYWQLFEKGVMSKPEILEARFAETLQKLGAERDPAEMNRNYFELLSNCHFLIDGAENLLGALKEKGYLIYAVTNGLAKTQYKRINESGLEGYFDGIFVSEAAGCQKPTREYYDYVLKNTPVKDRSKILIIGDSMTSDIKGGIDSGIDTCWYDGFGEEKIYEPTYTVKTLAEIKELL